MNRRAIGQARKFGTVTGKGFRASIVRLRGLKMPVLAITLVLVLVTAVVPFAILLLQSLSAAESVYSLKNLTLQFWVGASNPAFARGEPGILRNLDMWHATWNSVKLAVMASGLCVVIGLPLALCVQDPRSGFVARIVEMLTFIPYMTPALAFGAVYLLMFARRIGPIPALYGTFALLVVVSVAKHIPYAVRTETAALTQVAGDLVDVARVMGVRTPLLLRRILIPLVRPSMIASFVMMMISNMKELSLVVLLVTPETQILTTYVYRYQELGHRGYSAAMVVFLIFLVLGLSTLVRRIQGDDLSRGAVSDE